MPFLRVRCAALEAAIVVEARHHDPQQRVAFAEHDATLDDLGQQPHRSDEPVDRVRVLRGEPDAGAHRQRQTDLGLIDHRDIAADDACLLQQLHAALP
jgi:hypothetical protein